jgi:pilus assembly protein CpaF
MAALNTLVSEAVDVVVHCARRREGIRVQEVMAVEDLQAVPDAVNFTTTELFRRVRPDGELEWTGLVPGRAQRALEATGTDIRTLLGAR